MLLLPYTPISFRLSFTSPQSDTRFTFKKPQNWLWRNLSSAKAFSLLDYIRICISEHKISDSWGSIFVLAVSFVGKPTGCTESYSNTHRDWHEDWRRVTVFMRKYWSMLHLEMLPICHVPYPIFFPGFPLSPALEPWGCLCFSQSAPHTMCLSQHTNLPYPICNLHYLSRTLLLPNPVY